MANKIADSLLLARQQVSNQARLVKEELTTSDKLFKELLTRISDEKAQSGLHAYRVVVAIAWENDRPVVESVDVQFAEL